MAINFNRNRATTFGNHGVTITAFENAYIPAVNFGLRIDLVNVNSVQNIRIDFILLEIINGVIQPAIRDTQTIIPPLGAGNQYSPSLRYVNNPNFYVHQVNVTPEVSVNSSVDITTFCYHL